MCELEENKKRDWVDIRYDEYIKNKNKDNNTNKDFIEKDNDIKAFEEIVKNYNFFNSSIKLLFERIDNIEKQLQNSNSGFSINWTDKEPEHIKVIPNTENKKDMTLEDFEKLVQKYNLYNETNIETENTLNSEPVNINEFINNPDYLGSILPEGFKTENFSSQVKTLYKALNDINTLNDLYLKKLKLLKNNNQSLKNIINKDSAEKDNIISELKNKIINLEKDINDNQEIYIKQLNDKDSEILRLRNLLISKGTNFIMPKDYDSNNEIKVSYRENE